MAAEIKSGKVKIEFSLSASLKKKISKQAKKQNVSVSQLMRDISQQYLKKGK